jgi:UDP-N-acetylmuramoyl-tripeptide--D-alanyl-D-alanine ligase
MATRGLGQLTYLAEIAAPAVGIVTAVAPVHLETIGTLDAVARAKAELLRALPPGGWSVVNADSPHLAVEIGKGGIGGPVLSFGFGSRAQVRASGGATAFRREKDTVRARLSFEVEVPDAGVREMLGLSEQKLAASLPYPGRHNALNALAAAIGCAAVAVPFAAALQSLATFGPRSAMRLDISVRSGVVLVDDAYNANPLSMIAALEILQGVSGGGRRLAALGDMLELGPLEAESHRDLGRAVASFGLDLLVAFGPAMRLAVEEAVAAGMPPDRIHHTESHAEVLEVLLDKARPGDALLIKGSRGMAMERITAGLRGRWR